MNKERVHEESLSSLASTLQQDFVRLIDAEKALAREEINGKVRELKRDALLLASATLVAGLFLLCLVAASILALSLVLAPWAAALCVAGFFGVGAAVLLTVFFSKIQKLDPVPRTTLANVKRDVRAVQEAVR
jgi:hypothetical protein